MPYILITMSYQVASALEGLMGATKYLEQNMSDEKSTRGMYQIYTFLSAYYYDFQPCGNVTTYYLNV